MKINVLLLFTLLSPLFIKAQQSLPMDSISALKMICQSELIFEGKVLSQGKAFRASDGNIYTPYDVAVTSAFSGQPTASTIQIIMIGGSIIGEDGMGYGVSVDDGVGFSLCSNSIIFCNKSKITDLPNAYTVRQQVCFSEKNEITNSEFLSQYYSDINVLLKDMSNILKVKIPQKKSPEINVNENDPDTLSYSEKLKNYNTYIALQEQRGKNSQPVSAKTAGTNYLTISTGNESITSDGTARYFEFDVLAAANVSGMCQ